MSISKEREGVFGKYTEHLDDDGNVIGESRKRQGVFGEYIERIDSDGNKIVESRQREGTFGDYTEHTGVDGNKIGESRNREGILGDYIEHRDAKGNKIGESRQREGIFGKYTEHTESANYAGQGNAYDTERSSVHRGGLLDTIAQYAARIGVVLGAILGLLNAYDESYGLWGYIISPLAGAVIGGVLASFAVYGIALALVAVLFLLLLRACGADVPLPF